MKFVERNLRPLNKILLGTGLTLGAIQGLDAIDYNTEASHLRASAEVAEAATMPAESVMYLNAAEKLDYERNYRIALMIGHLVPATSAAVILVRSNRQQSELATQSPAQDYQDDGYIPVIGG